MSIYDWENEGGMYNPYDDYYAYDDTSPVTLDTKSMTRRQIRILMHVHDLDGTCVHNRYGARCE